MIGTNQSSLVSGPEESIPSRWTTEGESDCLIGWKTQGTKDLFSLKLHPLSIPAFKVPRSSPPPPQACPVKLLWPFEENGLFAFWVFGIAVLLILFLGGGDDMIKSVAQASIKLFM